MLRIFFFFFEGGGEIHRQTNGGTSQSDKVIYKLFLPCVGKSRLKAPQFLFAGAAVLCDLICSLRRAFVSDIDSAFFSESECLPMLLSSWSHYNGFHLFVNMYVLFSCGRSVTTLGTEDFLGFYVTAGVLTFFFVQKEPK